MSNVWGTTMYESEAYKAEQHARNKMFKEVLDKMPIKQNKMTDFTKPVQTRSGLPVTIITTKGRGKYCVLGFVGEDEFVTRWNIDGRIDCSKVNHELDLINVPEKRVMYVNIYRELVPFAYMSREHADQDKYIKDRIACIRVEYTEGQFDD